MRECGILLPITSLASKYGIGCFSIEAYQFVDFLVESGQKYWQILPLGPTSYGDSPYQSFSAYAGNPYFIDLSALISEGLLSEIECNELDFGSNNNYVDYEKIYNSRFIALRKAYERSNFLKREECIEFVNNNQSWLKDYALFMAIKGEFNNCSWGQWDDDIKLRKPEAIEYYTNKLQDEIHFQEFLQYEFSFQWQRLKKYANEKGVEIVGDIPIYVAFDSSDSWANSELFQFDEKMQPTAVAGCPPDSFAATGQLWGNPLYKWNYHKDTNYEWWIERIKYSFKLYDVVRIDHFRGFDEYYSIPFGEPTAENGHWEKGPGYDLFKAIKSKLGELNIIAEDLGYLTESVKQLLEDTGYPGMKLIQFAFDSREESDYIPHTYNKNCIAYTGTHDNDTLVGWMNAISSDDRQMAIDYLNLYDKRFDDCNWDIIRLTLASVAKIAIIPIQDYLGLGSEARINTPSTLGGNWMWRLRPYELDGDLANCIKKVNKIYGRVH